LTVIALSGYYGFHNAGDEAILEALITALRRCQPDVELVVFSADPDHTRKAYHVEAVSRVCLSSIISTLRRADLLISGGGGLLQDVTGPRSIPYYLGMMELAMFMGTRVAIFAQGVGPLRSRWSRLWVKKVLSRVDFISVRDAASAHFLNELGVMKAIEITADPVFSLKPASGKDIASFWEAGGLKKSPGELLVGIALRPYPGEKVFDEKILAVIANGCHYLRKEFGAKLIYLPFHWKKDLPLARVLASRDLSRGVVFEGNLSPENILKLMGGLDLLIGMRLHALIFAAICGVPFIALPYDPKVNAFLENIGEKPTFSLEDLTFQKLLANLKDVLSRGEEYRENLQLKIKEQGEKVDGTVARLLSLANQQRGENLK
jgi:polysaccharide pyruvyl transferase CsaB